MQLLHLLPRRLPSLLLVPSDPSPHHRHDLDVEGEEHLQEPSPEKNRRNLQLAQKHPHFQQAVQGLEGLVLVVGEHRVDGVPVFEGVLDETLPVLEVDSQLFFGGEDGFLVPAGHHSNSFAF